jgi:hypothetical protein
MLKDRAQRMADKSPNLYQVGTTRGGHAHVMPKAPAPKLAAGQDAIVVNVHADHEHYDWICIRNEPAGDDILNVHLLRPRLGDVVHVLAEPEGEWVKIAYRDVEGYIAAGFLEQTAKNETKGPYR